MPKVVHIIARLNIGGPAINVVLLADRVDKRRFSSVIVTGTEGKTEGSMRYLADERGISPVVIPEMGREISWRDDLAAFVKLIALLRRERPQIIHTHTAKAGFLGRAAALIALPGRGKRVIHTFHGHVFHSYFGPRKTRAFIQIERFLARYTHSIVAVSERTRQELIGYGICPPDKIVTIPLGLDLDPFVECDQHTGELKRELGIAQDAVIVGIVARLVPVKGIDVFLRAAACVAAARPDAYFVIVGDGEQRASLERLAQELEISDRVRFLGFRRDLPRICADCNVIALSSHNEGLPTSLVEAMAAGRIVVATNVGGVGDLIEDGVTGYLTPPNDPGALADATLRALEECLAHEAMKLRARQRAIDRYDVQRLICDIERLYGGTSL